MTVACFCGATFQTDGDLIVCPGCGEPAVVPHVTTRGQQDMELELARLLTPDQGDA